jgi:methylmalonyl-CoA carboxyltransferase small subunit
LKLRIDLDGKSYDLDVEILEEDPPSQRPRYLPHHAPPTTLRSAHAAGAAEHSVDAAPAEATGSVDESSVCRCPVSGVVNHVAVTVGQALQPNDLIMVLEAMKMETNVVADREGTVKALRVADGDAVKAGQVLMDYD